MGAFDALAEAWWMMRKRPKVLGLWLWIAVLNLVAALLAAKLILGDVMATNQILEDLFKRSILLSVIFGVVDLVLVSWASAVTLLHVGAYSREEASLAHPLREGLRRTPSLVLLIILRVLLLAVSVALPAVIIVLIVRASWTISALFTLGIFCWFLIFITRISLADAALVLNELPPSEAISWSWDYSREAFFSLLGLFVLLLLMGFLLHLLTKIPLLGAFLTPFVFSFQWYLGTAAFGFMYVNLRQGEERTA